MTLKPSVLLNKFRVSNDANIFQIGCTARLLNVHAQQQRVFNLVWGLINEKVVKKNQPIAVIGAGISGITAASALLVAGYKVHLFERTADIIHLQRGNETRFLHPNIQEWPNEGFAYPLTQMPFMNWRAADAGHVIEQLFRQWESVLDIAGDRLVLVMNSTVGHLRWDTRTRQCFFQAQCSEKAYEAVILAVGYGIERPRYHTTPSYWRNDDLAQPVIGREGKKRILVSGTGDGGLIEVLRLTIKDFQHQTFIQDVMFNAWFQKQGEELQAKLKGKSKVDEWEVWNEFIKEPSTDGLDSLLKDIVREDTEVDLLGRNSFPSKADSILLHRIFVASLIRKGFVNYVTGSLLDPNSSEDEEKDEVAKLKAAETPEEKATMTKVFVKGEDKPLYFDLLIERNGEEPLFERLFEDGSIGEAARDSWDEKNDCTWKRQEVVLILWATF